MSKRKIIKFGNSSYVVTIPNEWIKINKLDKGDFISIKQFENSLIITPQKEKEEKIIEINIDNMPLKIFNKKLMSYYLKNFKYIKLVGNKVIERIEEIRIIKEKLSSIEIYEIGKDFILLKDLTNPQSFEIYDLIYKVIDVVKILFDEIMQESRHHFIMQIDSNINKLTFLMWKTINYNLDRQEKIAENKNAIYYWRIASSLETIGDILKRIERYISKSDTQSRQNIIMLLKNLKEYYIFITCMIDRNINIDNNLKIYLDKKQSFLKEIEEFKEKVTSEKNNSYLVVIQLIKDVIGRLDILTLAIIDIHSN